MKNLFIVEYRLLHHQCLLHSQFNQSLLTASVCQHGCQSLIRSALITVPHFMSFFLWDKPLFIQHDAEKFDLMPVWQILSVSAFDSCVISKTLSVLLHSFPWPPTSTDMQRHCLTLCTLRCLKGGCRSGQSSCTVSCVMRCGLQKEQDWNGSWALLWLFLPEPEPWPRFWP